LQLVEGRLFVDIASGEGFEIDGTAAGTKGGDDEVGVFPMRVEAELPETHRVFVGAVAMGQQFHEIRRRLHR
jgi:hypothetical protein